jgi:hypothetical protein
VRRRRQSARPAAGVPIGTARHATLALLAPREAQERNGQVIMRQTIPIPQQAVPCEVRLLRRDRQPPLVCIPWEVYGQLVHADHERSGPRPPIPLPIHSSAIAEAIDDDTLEALLLIFTDGSA